MRGPHNAERKLTEPASTPRALAGLDAAPGDLQRLPQDLAVADVVGEDEDELAVHHFGFGFAQVPLAVDQLLIEAVGVGNVGVEFEGQSALLQAAQARAMARSIFAASKPRQRAATCWSGRIR